MIHTSLNSIICCLFKYKKDLTLQFIPAFLIFFFFFQAEDGIRDHCVTGVQTCALPIQSRSGIRDHCVTGVQTCALPISSSTRLNSSHTVISYAVFCLRSEEHTSELQSHSDLVCRLLLEKKKKEQHRKIVVERHRIYVT